MEAKALSLEPMSEAITRLAYLFWEQDGRPQGREIEHWCQAKLMLAAAFPARTVAQSNERTQPLPKPARSKSARRGRL